MIFGNTNFPWCDREKKFSFAIYYNIKSIDFIRSQKLNGVEPCQYLDEGPIAL